MKFISQENNLLQTIKRLNPEFNSVFPDTALIERIEEILNQIEITYAEIGETCEVIEKIAKKEIPVTEFEEKLLEKLDEDNREKVATIVSEINEKIFTKILPALGISPLTINETPAETQAQEEGNPVQENTETQEAEISAPRMPINDSGIEFNEQDKIDSQSEPDSAESVAQSQERSVPIKKIIPEKPKEQAEIKPSYISNTKDFGFENFQPSKLAPVPPQPLSEFSTTKVYTPTSTANSSEISSGAQSNFSRPPIVEMNSERMSENPLGSFLKMLSSKLSEKELQARFDKLPYTLKNALRSVDSAKKVLDIGRKYALHVDKLGELGEETGMVILGMTPTSQFLPRLSRRLGINEEKTKSLAQEINNEVFLKIREALKQVNGEVPSSYTSNTLKTRLSPIQPNEAEPIKKSEEVLPNREAILKDIENPNSSTSLDTEKFTAQDWFKPEPEKVKISQNIRPAEPAKPVPPQPPKFVPPQKPVSSATPPVPPMPPKPVSQIPTPPRPPVAPPKPVEDRLPQPPAPPKPKAPEPMPKIVIAPAPKASTPNISSTPSQNPIKETPREIPKIVIGQRPIPTMPAKNIIEQKLGAPVQSKKTEAKYSSDPYREPIA